MKTNFEKFLDRIHHDAKVVLDRLAKQRLERIAWRKKLKHTNYEPKS